ALQTTNCRSASWKTLSVAIRRCLSAREPTEHGADCQSKPAQVAFGKNIPGHYFPGGINILEWSARLIEHKRPVVHGNSHVRKRDTGPQRKAVKRRKIDGHGPVALGWGQAAGACAVQFLHTDFCVPRRRAIVLFDRSCEDIWVEAHRRAQRSECI